MDKVASYRDMRLFKPYKVNGLELKNRVMLTALVTNLATEDGYVTDDLIKRYSRIARGGTGWLVTECVVVHPRKSPFNMRISDDRYIEGLRRFTDTIHAESEAKIGIQVGDFLKIARHWRQKVEDVSKEEIKERYDYFVSAAKRVKQCGFDSLEFDAESGMLLSQFLSRKNKRADEYGGSLENRQRLLLEVCEAYRDILGPEYVIGARINGEDLVLGGSTLLDSSRHACELARRGIDYISVSAGGQYEDALPSQGDEPQSAYTGYSGLRCWPRAWDPDGANVYLAEGIRKALHKAGYQTSVVTAGKIPTAEFAEEVLQEGKADIIGLARPLLCDPDWVNKYLEGLPEDIVHCVYCNHCSEVNDLFQLTDCALWPKGSKHPPEPFLPKKKKTS